VSRQGRLTRCSNAGSETAADPHQSLNAEQRLSCAALAEISVAHGRRDYVGAVFAKIGVPSSKSGGASEAALTNAAVGLFATCAVTTESWVCRFILEQFSTERSASS
jgi:hypothetical protein